MISACPFAFPAMEYWFVSYGFFRLDSMEVSFPGIFAFLQTAGKPWCRKLRLITPLRNNYTCRDAEDNYTE